MIKLCKLSLITGETRLEANIPKRWCNDGKTNKGFIVMKHRFLPYHHPCWYIERADSYYCPELRINMNGMECNHVENHKDIAYLLWKYGEGTLLDKWQMALDHWRAYSSCFYRITHEVKLYYDIKIREGRFGRKLAVITYNYRKTKESTEDSLTIQTANSTELISLCRYGTDIRLSLGKNKDLLYGVYEYAEARLRNEINRALCREVKR